MEQSEQIQQIVDTANSINKATRKGAGYIRIHPEIAESLDAIATEHNRKLRLKKLDIIDEV